MKVLDRYILRAFSNAVFVSFVMFVGIEAIEESFRILPKITDQKETLQILFKYLFYKLPYLISLVAPLSVLFGSLLCFGLLGRRGELVSIFACGIDELRLLKMPLIACCIILCFSLYLSNIVVPYSELKIEKLLKKEYIQQPIRYKTDEYFVSLENFVEKAKLLRGLEIKCIRDGKLCYHLVGKKAIWTTNHWQVSQAKVYKFTDTSFSGSMHFRQLRLSDRFIYPPKYLALLQYMPQHLTTYQLYKKLSLTRSCTINTYPIQTTIQLRYAYPFSCILTLLVGFFLVIQRPFGGLAYSFGISIVVSMFYWGLLSTLVSMCEVGHLPAYTLWLPNILLAAIVLVIILYRSCRNPFGAKVSRRYLGISPLR